MEYSKGFWRGLFFILLIATLCGGLMLPAMSAPTRAAPQMQIATDLVISEFRFRGSTGAGDEFIEIYNPTTAQVNLNGWKINGSNNAGSSGTRYTFSTNIFLQPGQHYLISHTSYNDTVAADATYSSGIADDGGVALLRPDNSIADQVGLSTGSLYKEGTVLTSLTSNTDQSYERQLDISGSCTDANNNASDFFLRNPSDPQNFSSPITTCGNPTPTPSPTSTSTSTATSTGTATNTSTATQTNTPTTTGTVTNTPTPTGFLSILINEVAWAGTGASTDDEWIELYNPGSSPVNLAGWILKGADGTPNIGLTGTIPAGGFFLLERTDDSTVIDATADQIYSGALANSDEILQLFDVSNRLVDTANSNGGVWPAGNSTTFNSMERRGVIIDSDTAWITNVQSSTWTKHDARGTTSTNYLIHGTPGYGNWAISVTPTFSPTPTKTATPRAAPTKTPQPTPLPPPPLVAINEFVPRPGHDWNGDGVINVGDEYIELLNHGVIDVNLSGYSLDDEVNIGSPPYPLPAITLKPGERRVFYGSETGLLLSDGGDGVRLLKPNGQLMDAYNYFVVRFPDQSYCRLPDNGGADDWNQNCFPTPGLQNSLSGSSVNPPTAGGEESLCPIADTLPYDFVLAECLPFGNNIWNPAYWDKFGWFNERYLPKGPGKWPVFVD
jgi:Lamin Tail Domain